MKSDEWCNGKDIVYDSKTHRCSVCGRRLSGSGSRATYIDGNGVEIKLNEKKDITKKFITKCHIEMFQMRSKNVIRKEYQCPN